MTTSRPSRWGDDASVKANAGREGPVTVFLPWAAARPPARAAAGFVLRLAGQAYVFHGVSPSVAPPRRSLIGTSVPPVVNRSHFGRHGRQASDQTSPDRVKRPVRSLSK